MNYRTFETTVTYQSNCHYGESKKSVQVSVPLRKPTITFAPLYNSILNSDNEKDLFYNDELLISVHVIDDTQTVQWGTVIFYYIDKDDITQTRQQININPISVDKLGNASIKYIPHNDGEFEVEYFGDPYYESATAKQNFTLQKRPVYLEFSNYAPNLIDPDETVKMEVKVTDEKTNAPLEYGLVTFLNYHAFRMEDTESDDEKVIGNPRYIINSKADITYSPIQLGTNELLNNIELICAVYNYDNNQYGVQWKYYAQKTDWTSISIRRKNQINLLTPKIKNGTDYDGVSINDVGIFTMEETQTLVCQCSLNLNDLSKVITDEDNKHFVKFIVEGTKYSYENGEKISSDFRQIYDADYIFDEESDEKYFERLINLEQGSYEIYAKVDNPTMMIGDEEIEIPVNVTNVDVEDSANLPTQNKDDRKQHIRDGIYLKSNKSESFYIKVEPQNNILTLDLYCNNTLSTIKTLSKNDIYCEIAGDLTDDDKSILNNKICYFLISNTNKVIKGTIKSVSDKLIAKPDNDIVFDAIGDYRIYAYILEGTYSSNSISRKYKTTYSNDTLIRIRNKIDISLRINTIEKTYPGDVKYIINGSNLDMDSINIDVYVDDHFISSHILNDLNSMITNAIPNEITENNNKIGLKDVGTHTVKVVVTTEPYKSVTKTEDYTINKDNLLITLNNISKNVYTSLQSDIILGIESQNGNDLGYIDPLLLEATISDSSGVTQNIKNSSSISVTKMNNKYYQVTVPGSIYDEGEWKIKLDYLGSSNYNKTENDWIMFNAQNHKPYCVNISADTSKMVNKIVYAQTSNFVITKLPDDKERIDEIISYDAINQRILVVNKISKNGDSPITIASITDLNGEYTINRPNNISESAWTEYNTIQVTVNPKHILLSNYLENENNAINAFNNTFGNDYQCTDTEKRALCTQAKNNKWKTLFLGYESIVDIITIYRDDDESAGGDDDGTE